MALVDGFESINKERATRHDSVTCAYAVVEVRGERLLQLETYGRDSRKLKGKVSQTLQLTRGAALELKRIIERTFG